MNEHKNEKSQEEKEEEVIDRLDSLDIVKTIGTGSFATVKLCKHVMTRQCFALKTMSILEMIKMKQVQHVKNEKKVLQQVNHPFIIKLMWSHIDKSSIHFLFPFVNGGELFYHLRKCERFPVNRVRFYSSEIVSALAYLHSLKIVYRDLKPENILLDSQGHIVLTDFGFAKTISDLSWTVCGTPDYLAPEVIQSRGHNKSVDWWALGILIYEMMHGYPPFYDDNNLGLYRKILSSPYYWRLSSKDTGIVNCKATEKSLKMSYFRLQKCKGYCSETDNSRHHPEVGLYEERIPRCDGAQVLCRH